jgi:non-reducing end alpha-L-arabinofuranosidase
MRSAMNRITVLFSLVLGLNGLSGVQQNVFAQTKLPCDIYAAGGTPCVAAHSTVRSLYGAYSGPLYQVRLKSDTTKKKDIYPKVPGGYANAASVDSFLQGTTGGTVSVIYDQSERKNHLWVSQWGSARPTRMRETPATRFKDTISGHIVYPLATDTGEGYRNNKTNGVATGNQNEGMYCVVKGGNHPKKVSSDCCWDYGNAESDADAGGKKTGVMEALYFGSNCWFTPCNGNGPWFFADLEWGLFQGTAQNGTTNTSIPYEYASGYLKGDVSTYTIKAADATQDVLKLMGTTTRPAPKILTGGIILGIGGDSAPSGYGTFFEGAMTIGNPPDSAENLVQKNIALVYSNKDIVNVMRHSSGPSPASHFRASSNPSTGRAVIGYVLRDVGRVSVDMLDQRGRHVAAVVRGIMTPGRHEAVWDASRVPAGVYIVRAAIDGRNAWTGRIIAGK